MKTTIVRTVIIGSGCAGLNAAAALSELGEKDILLLTDGMNRGTSRNAGSDKQTYYRLSLSGDVPDCVGDMARDLMGEGVHGDTALAEAAGSAPAFLRLAQFGVPFPTNFYGEYPGYRTDHDSRGRGTSAGPLTSKMMTECLERRVHELHVPVLDNATAFALLKDEHGIAGVLAYTREGLRLIVSAHVILATGGAASAYAASVYPESQQGMSGMALMAGAHMANLHQWQYGLASVKFRWNVSGSYQQVLPRYISVDEHGTRREFLADTFDDPMRAVNLCFLKGYQWPFDVRKADASSMIDLLIHRECAMGRHVYMDFLRNPKGLRDDLSNLGDEAREYLLRTGATQNTPIARLMRMNAPAIDLYRNHGIDLTREMLEVRVCAQHHNGGVAVDANWMSSIEGLYAVGEAAGTFGAYRPGGSALNATQVGSMRAARHIAYDSDRMPMQNPETLYPQIERALQGLRFENPDALSRKFQQAMSDCASHMRSLSDMEALEKQASKALEDANGTFDALPPDMEQRVRLRDQLWIQRGILSAMRWAADVYGSTGAGLVLDDNGKLHIPALGISARAHRNPTENLVADTCLTGENCVTNGIPARPLPDRELWFENVWKADTQRRNRRKTSC